MWSEWVSVGLLLFTVLVAVQHLAEINKAAWSGTPGCKIAEILLPFFHLSALFKSSLRLSWKETGKEEERVSWPHPLCASVTVRLRGSWASWSWHHLVIYCTVTVYKLAKLYKIILLLLWCTWLVRPCHSSQQGWTRYDL